MNLKGPKEEAAAELLLVWWKVDIPHQRDFTQKLECLVGGIKVVCEKIASVPGEVFGDGTSPGTGRDELEEITVAAANALDDGTTRIARIRIHGMPVSAAAVSASSAREA